MRIITLLSSQEKRKAEAEAESEEEEEPHGKVSYGGAVKSSAGAAAADEPDYADAQRFQRRGKTLEFGPR